MKTYKTPSRLNLTVSKVNLLPFTANTRPFSHRRSQRPRISSRAPILRSVTKLPIPALSLDLILRTVHPEISNQRQRIRNLLKHNRLG